MTTEPTASSNPTPNGDPMTKMELLLQQMAMMDIDPADLAAYAEGHTTPGAVTVASFLALIVHENSAVPRESIDRAA